MSRTRHPRSSRRLSKQDDIHEQLRDQILQGHIPVGSLLPPIRELAARYGTSLTPVNLAIDRLEKEGLVTPMRGSGVIVRAASSTESMVRARPIVEVVTSLSSSKGEAMSASTLGGMVPPHSLCAVEEALLSALHEFSGLRIQACMKKPDAPPEQMARILEEALVYRPAVLALPFPENVLANFSESLYRLKEVGTCVVLRATRVDTRDFDRLYCDFAGGQRLLTQHLIDRGKKNILRCSFTQSLLFEKQKQAGFEDALETIGIPQSTALEWTHFVPLSVQRADHATAAFEYWLKTLAEILQRRPDVDAVMAPNDYDSVPIQLALRSLGHPEIEVTGYDNDWSDRWDEIRSHFPAAREMRAPATVDTQHHQFGRSMAGLVAARALGHLPPEIQTRNIPQVLVVPTSG